MDRSFRTAFVTAAAMVAAAVWVLVGVLGDPEPEAWRVAAAWTGTAIFVGMLAAVVGAWWRSRRREGGPDGP